MRTRDLVCPFCLADRAALRIDRKNRPYIVCTCGTRCFIPNLRDAVRFIAVVESVLRGHVEQMAANPTYATSIKNAEAAVSAAFATMMNDRAAPPTPAETPTTLTTTKTA